MAALKTGAFAPCTVSLGTTIDRCGTITQCNAIPMEIDQIDSVYITSGNYRIMGSLFEYEWEIKACQVEQKGLAGFLRANKKSGHSGAIKKTQTGLFEVEPFFLLSQPSLINNQYWTFTGGTLSLANGTPDPAGTYWQITATSPTGIPVATGWFNADERVFLTGVSAGGSAINGQYKVTISTVVGSTMVLTLEPANLGSFMPAAKIENPTLGYLQRGTANKSDYERFCAETPGLNTAKRVPFWIETVRMAMCRGELYNKYRRLLLANNPEYATFGDIPDVELNRQQGRDYEDRFWNTVLWGKAINASQTLSAYLDLPTITVPAGDIVTAGFDIGECVGRKANTIGFIEQHAQCSRLVDLQGGRLNLPALFESLRIMQRVRKANGSAASNVFDIFTDQKTARAIRLAMLAYYKAESQDMLEMHINVDAKDVQKAPMGFRYFTYDLMYPSVTINIIWDEAFDDLLTESTAAGVENTGRWLWILDWTKNYVSTIASDKRENVLGNLDTISGFDSFLACVMKLPKRNITLISQTYAVVSECPAGDLMINNFSGETPEPESNIVEGSYG